MEPPCLPLHADLTVDKPSANIGFGGIVRTLVGQLWLTIEQIHSTHRHKSTCKSVTPFEDCLPNVVSSAQIEYPEIAEHIRVWLIILVVLVSSGVAPGDVHG